MKKLLLVISIISALLLVGCNKNQSINDNEVNNNDNQNQEEIQNNSGNINEEEEDEITSGDSVTINFEYTDLESLKNQNLLPNEVTIGELYDVGNVKIGNKTYEVKYIATNFKVGENEGEYGVKKMLKFYDGNDEKLELVVETELWHGEYIKEISIFNDKYLVAVTDTNTGDTWQFLHIYDENLNRAKINASDEYEKYLTLEEGCLSLHNRYENYYTIGENEITATFNTAMDSTKATVTVSEVDGALVLTNVDETTEGLIGSAGRT